MIKTLAELKSEVHNYHKDCRDAITTTRNLSFEGRTMAFKPEAGLFPGASDSGILNDWSGFQLTAKLDAPAYGWLFNEKHCPTELETQILNYLAATRDEQKIMVRNKGEGIRAVLSDQYTVFDNHQLVDLVTEAIGTMGVEPEIKRVATGDELSAYILFPQVTVENDPRSGGENSGRLHPAIHISNSERGGGSSKIAAAVFTGYCQNGLIYGWKSEDTLSIRHRYLTTEAMGFLVTQAIASGLKMSEEVAKKFVASQNVHIPKVSLANIVGDWASKYGLTVSARESWLGQIAGETNRCERPDDPRAFDIINAATFLAQQLEPVEALTMERMAGDLLAAYNPVVEEVHQD